MEDGPEADTLRTLIEGSKALEGTATKAIQKAMKKHPLGPWMQHTVGIGAKQLARLLGPLGDPYMRPELHWSDGRVEPARPRLVSELWSLAGYNTVAVGGDAGQLEDGTHGGDARVAPHRVKGQRSRWNPELRMRVFLISESCVKQRSSPYRKVYDDAREKYADAVHATECKRCGPSGKPAPAGSPLSPGHQHARALRLVSKAILRDLWIEAKKIHEGTT